MLPLDLVNLSIMSKTATGQHDHLVVKQHAENEDHEASELEYAEFLDDATIHWDKKEEAPNHKVPGSFHCRAGCSRTVLSDV